MNKQEVTISADTGHKAEQKQINKKRPSRLFTHYYGSMILLLISILVAGGFLIIKPKIDSYKQTKAQTLTVESKIIAEKQYFNDLSRSVAAANTIDSDVLSKVDKALPRGLNIPQMLVQIERAAQSHNVRVSNISFEQTQTKKTAVSGLQSVGVTLSVRAKDYQSLKNFLNSLETSLRLMDLKLMSVAQFDEEGVSFSVQLQVYYYPPEQG